MTKEELQLQIQQGFPIGADGNYTESVVKIAEAIANAIEKYVDERIAVNVPQ